MRSLSGTLIFVSLVSAVALTILPCRPAGAFHSGGVGNCDGCHAIHKSDGDQAPNQNPSFLNSSDPSSTCLTCHMKQGGAVPAGECVATSDVDMPAGVPPAQLTPGGDFGWLKKNYRWNASDDDAGGQSPGERHGHNIVAADKGFVADSTLTVAPGGTYPARGLSCISCHDPHGKYRRVDTGAIVTSGKPIRASGSYETSIDPDATFSVGVYRLLGGVGYTPVYLGSHAFTANPPAAVSPSDYNRPEDRTDTRVAYGSGMSEWCMNCHASYSGSSEHPGHPAGNSVKMSSNVVASYNAYIGSGNLSGKPATSYTSMVPFEMGTSDYSLLKRTANKDGSVASGPDSKSNVMCLTCHRAHASGWDKATRWNMNAGMLVWNGNYPGTDRGGVPAMYSQGRTSSEIKKTFHDRPAGSYAVFQRSLCNKCHAKD
jgi:hypothetical protein